MPRRALSLGCLLLLAPVWADSSTPQAGAPPLERNRAAVAFQSGLALDHSMRDMIDVLFHSYAAKVSLRVEKSGVAVLEFHGKVRVEHSRIPVPGPADATSPGGPREVPLDDRWIGTARWVGTTLEVHFDRSEAYRPAIAVDLLWRCVPTTVTVAGASQSAYRCSTDQHRTRPSGGAYHLPPYLQVPIVVAMASARLHVKASARGGADHHAELQHVDYQRR